MTDAHEEDRLAIRAQAGDPVALAELYRAVAPSLLAFLERQLGARSEAEDVLHDSFLRLVDGSRPYEARGRFRSWMFTVAGRIALDRHRKRRRRGDLQAFAEEATTPPAPTDPARDAEHAELRRRIDRALADLPERYAATFHLRVRERLPYGEIARILGEAEGTLRSRIHHTMSRLRAALEAAGYERPRPAARPHEGEETRE